MKHDPSACILIPTLARYTVQLKYGLKCMHSDCVSSQVLVSVLFIAVTTDTENPISYASLNVVQDNAMSHRGRSRLF